MDKGSIIVTEDAYHRVACQLHETARRKRLAKEKGTCRPGEADPSILFWNKVSSSSTAASSRELKECDEDDKAVYDDLGNDHPNSEE